jgi:hypothetical protein
MRTNVLSIVLSVVYQKNMYKELFYVNFNGSGLLCLPETCFFQFLLLSKKTNPYVY